MKAQETEVASIKVKVEYERLPTKDLTDILNALRRPIMNPGQKDRLHIRDIESGSLEIFIEIGGSTLSKAAITLSLEIIDEIKERLRKVIKRENVREVTFVFYDYDGNIDEEITVGWDDIEFESEP